VIAGLILAAGAGTRFGSAESKLLAELDGRPLLEHAVRAQCAVSSVQRVVVVLGHQAHALLSRVDWHEGQAATLRCGAVALAGATKVIVTLGDEPLVSAQAVSRFVDPPAGARAIYNGRPGHPVVLGPEQLAAIASLTGDRGARDLLGGGPLIECSDLCSDRDVDTRKDLEEVRNEARAVV